MQNTIKIGLLAGMLWFLSSTLKAQDWNPYVGQASISPSPLIPAEFDGTGEFIFKAGNSGSSVMRLVKNQEMTMMITLSLGIPVGENPASSVGGSWASLFTWSYDPQVKTFTGIQNQDIPAESEGNVVIRFKVVANSGASSPSNGCNVNLQQPPYTNGVNFTHDDDVSAYTYIRAFDYGDAPDRYGEAVHEIDVSRENGKGNYLNYVYLGSMVDPEPSALYSAGADGDDFHGKDDEDGVLFPELVRGDTVAVPVKVTVHEGGYGVLYGWMDWNADGDFTDPGEKITGPVDYFESATTTLTLEIPGNAETSRPVYARFRLGENKSNPSGPQAWGEVEDYQLFIKAEKRNPTGQSGSHLPPSDQENSKRNPYISPANTSAGALVFRETVLRPGGNEPAQPNSVF